MFFSDVLVRMTAHSVFFLGYQFNISVNADISFAMGEWAFYGVSVDTNDEGTASTITVYANGIVLEYDIPEVPTAPTGPGL